jgi:hypothetical protein
MTKQDIIDYVMHTPHNTNRAVLNSMLNQIGGENNPIVVKTIQSTIKNPFSDYFENIDVQNLHNEAMFNDVTLILRVDGQVLGVEPFTTYINSNLNGFYCSQASIFENSVDAYNSLFNIEGNLQEFKYATGGTIIDGLAYSDLIPSTLTIIYHPYEKTFVNITYNVGNTIELLNGVPLDTVIDTRKNTYFPNSYMNWIIDRVEGDAIQKDEYVFKVKGDCTIYLKQSENDAA